MPSTPIEVTTLPVYDQIKTAVFFIGIIFLTILMGVLNYGEQLAGLDVELYLLYAGTAWADRVTFALRVLHIQDRSLDTLTLDLQDQVGEGNVSINESVSGRPLPIVLGGGPCA